jgi:predicted nucleic acid-binding protein
MSRLVQDANVLVKWILQDDDSERDTAQALALAESFRAGRVSLVQPVHWLVEVAAVCVRLKPDIVVQAAGLLYAMEIPVRNSVDVYRHACALAVELDHHLFDTLYHAVALDLRDNTLVTADRRYYRKARRLGAIALLADFAVP